MQDDKALAAAAADIETALAPQITEGLFDPKELCKLYQKVKGPLNVVLPWIEKIPVYGKAAVSAIRLLMQIADNLCPA